MTWEQRLPTGINTPASIKLGSNNPGVSPPPVALTRNQGGENEKKKKKEMKLTKAKVV